MLARPQRLVREREFREIYRRGERLGGFYTLIRVLSNRLPTSRFAVVMSTKVAKSAVIRNRHKRHIRAVIRELLPSLPSGWDVIVTVTKVVPDRSAWPAFREELRNLFARRFLA